MAISRSKNSSVVPAIARYILTSPSGMESEHEVFFGSNYSKSWYNGGRENELFHVGGGNPFVSELEYVYDFGSYLLTPKEDFLAWVHMWGAGGGNYNSGNDSARAGGGGFTQGLVLFKANIPYTLTVGEAGRYGTTATTHGGGGDVSNYNNSGSGGGLSGLFYNSTHYGKSPWAYSPPVSQSQALLIAGGGGGAGHHVAAGGGHGGGGGGGGWTGNQGHNSGPGGQNGGGHGSYYSSTTHSEGKALHGGRKSQQGTWSGAGGGGWFGGGGGGHSAGHHDGGSGGSGHHAMPSSVMSQPNNALATFVLAANTENAPSSFNQPRQYSANFKNPLAYRSSNPTYGEYGGYYAGRGGYGNSENTGRSGALHGKIVLTLFPDVLNRNKIKNDVKGPIIQFWSVKDDY